MDVRSGPKHLQYPEHLKAADHLEGVQRRQRQLDIERRAESAASGLQDLHFTAQHLDGPVTGRSNVRTQAEVEMWERYATDGAQFDAGDAQEDPDARHEQLRQQAEVFGLLNPEGVAKRLGFGGGDVAEEILGEEEEEDFLSEIMRHAGECKREVVWMVWFRPDWDWSHDDFGVYCGRLSKWLVGNPRGRWYLSGYVSFTQLQ